MGETATEAARMRGVDARHLVRLLHGDPDFIVIKAIAKDRRRRYDSAGDLAADIERYLRSEPVVAGPPGILYRASRFVRRHRIGVLVALALATSLVIGTTLATVGLLRARRAEGLARREAMRNALEAQAMRALLKEDEAGYIMHVNAVIDTWRHSAAEIDTIAYWDYLVNVVVFLDRLHSSGLSSARLDSFRTTLGVQAADLLFPRGLDERGLLERLEFKRDYMRRHLPERMANILRSMLLVREHLGTPDSAMSEDRRELARHLRETGSRLLEQGRPKAAMSPLYEAVEQARRAGPIGTMELAGARGDLGACLTEIGQYAPAESLLLESYRVLGSREQLMRLVRLYERSGRPSMARAYNARTRLESLRDLGSLEPLRGQPATSGRGIGFSGRMGDRWVWVFGPAIILRSLKAPSNIRWNSWSWTLDRDARDGLALQQPVDPWGVPRELLSLTPGEMARRDTADSWLNIAPAGLIEDPFRKRVLLLYTKTANGRPVGSSLAVWSLGRPAPRRVVVRPGSKEPLLLFQDNEPDFGAAALAVGDTLYLYGARDSAGFEWQMVLGRAPLARVLDRAAWRFFAGENGWVRDVHKAAVVMSASRQFCVQWNEHLRKFVAVSVSGLSELIEITTADHPEGPWSAPEVILTAMSPPRGAGWTCRPAFHPELGRDGGRVQYLTYERPLGFLEAEVRLVEVVFR